MPNSHRITQEGQDPSGIAFRSTLLYVGVAVTKGVLAWFSGSSALLADTIHAFSDLFASILVITGIWLSGKKAAAFPWGLYKIENFAALVSAGFIFFAGYEILGHALVSEQTFVLGHLSVSITSLTVMVVIILFFSRYEAKKAKALNSPSLRADAKHWYSDIASTVIVLIALLSAKVGYPFIDRVAALIMVGFIANAGWTILKDSMKTLLDASVEPDTLNRIRDTIQRFPHVNEIKSIQARDSGRFVFVRAEIVFDVKKFTEAHRLSGIIEETLLREIPHVDKVTIHYEPVEKGVLTYAIPVENDKHILSEHLGGSPYFYFIRVSAGSPAILQGEKILSNPYFGDEKGKGIKVSEWLLENDVDAVCTTKAFDGKGPFYLLSSAEVKVIVTEAKTIEEIRRNLENMCALRVT